MGSPISAVDPPLASLIKALRGLDEGTVTVLDADTVHQSRRRQHLLAHIHQGLTARRDRWRGLELNAPVVVEDERVHGDERICIRMVDETGLLAKRGGRVQWIALGHDRDGFHIEWTGWAVRLMDLNRVIDRVET